MDNVLAFILTVIIVVGVWALYVGAVGILITWLFNAVAVATGINCISYSTGMILSLIVLTLKWLLV